MEIARRNTAPLLLAFFLFPLLLPRSVFAAKQALPSICSSSVSSKDQSFLTRHNLISCLWTNPCCRPTQCTSVSTRTAPNCPLWRLPREPRSLTTSCQVPCWRSKKEIVQVILGFDRSILSESDVVDQKQQGEGPRCNLLLVHPPHQWLCGLPRGGRGHEGIRQGLSSVLVQMLCSSREGPVQSLLSVLVVRVPWSSFGDS